MAGGKSKEPNSKKVLITVPDFNPDTIDKAEKLFTSKNSCATFFLGPGVEIVLGHYDDPITITPA